MSLYIKLSILFFFSLLLSISSLKCSDTLSDRRLKILPVPTFGYEPETRTHIGAVVLFTYNFNSLRKYRPSTAKMEFKYTWNKQLIWEAGWNVFTSEEKWFTNGLIHYSKYPEYYYGIGANSPETNELLYSSRRLLAETSVLRRIKKYLFAGINLNYTSYSRLKKEENSIHFPELTEAEKMGIGWTILWDKRNHIFAPSSGNYLQIKMVQNFSSSHYGSYFLDGRYYYNWNQKQVLALRFLIDSKFGSPPFFDYSFQGGDQFVRGYLLGRFREKNLSAFQAEFRTPVFWRLGLALFGGVSSLSPRLPDLYREDIKYNIGMGLRFVFDREDQINLRFDLALGKGKSKAFYIAFGESF